MPPFTASSLRSRSLPLLTASALSLTLYTAHLHLRPVLSDDTLLDADADTGPSNKLRSALPTSLAPVSPYVPLGWGSNRYLTLFPDPSIAVVKRPTPLVHLGATPYRDLAIAEKYGACVDANGDCWMWGAGYDPSGEIGQSLRNRVGGHGDKPGVSLTCRRNFGPLHLARGSCSPSARTADSTASPRSRRSRTTARTDPSRPGGPGCSPRTPGWTTSS
jgi:hypothetical protein